MGLFKKNIVFSTLLVILLLLSCSPAPSIRHIEKPSWFYKPSIDGKIGGIGIAGEHINGLNEQKSLAIQRAIDDIAKQLGVEVKNITTAAAVGNRDDFQSTMETYSIQTVSGESVKAIIKELWEDPENKKLYVWMVVQ